MMSMFAQLVKIQEYHTLNHRFALYVATIIGVLRVEFYLYKIYSYLSGGAKSKKSILIATNELACKTFERE